MLECGTLLSSCHRCENMAMVSINSFSQPRPDDTSVLLTVDGGGSRSGDAVSFIFILSYAVGSYVQQYRWHDVPRTLVCCHYTPSPSPAWNHYRSSFTVFVHCHPALFRQLEMEKDEPCRQLHADGEADTGNGSTQWRLLTKRLIPLVSLMPHITSVSKSDFMGLLGHGPRLPFGSLPRKASFASGCICYDIYVRLSLHSGIMSKRGDAEGCGLHRRIAQCL